MDKENTMARFVVGIAAGKGGVGKSTVTVNLALALQAKGWNVGILDADLYGPSLSMMLPPDSLPSVCPTDPKRLLPAQSRGIKQISFSHFSNGDAAAMVRAPIANGLIKQFLHQVRWAPLDCLLIDFPPGTGDIQLTLIQEGNLSSGVIVSTPQEVALLDVAKAIHMFDKMNVPLLGIVENMCFFQDSMGERQYPFGKQGVRRFSQKMGIPFLGEIPIDSAITSCGDSGTSLLERFPDSSAALAFHQMATLVIDQLEAFAHLEGDALKQFEVVWET